MISHWFSWFSIKIYEKNFKSGEKSWKSIEKSWKNIICVQIPGGNLDSCEHCSELEKSNFRDFGTSPSRPAGLDGVAAPEAKRPAAGPDLPEKLDQKILGKNEN